MNELLNSVKFQIKELEKQQEKFKNSNTNRDVEMFMAISQRINELSMTALEISRHTATKL